MYCIRQESDRTIQESNGSSLHQTRAEPLNPYPAETESDYPLPPV